MITAINSCNAFAANCLISATKPLAAPEMKFITASILPCRSVATPLTQLTPPSVIDAAVRPMSPIMPLTLSANVLILPPAGVPSAASIGSGLGVPAPFALLAGID